MHLVDGIVATFEEHLSRQSIKRVMDARGLSERSDASDILARAWDLWDWSASDTELEEVDRVLSIALGN